ncbi:MAG: amidohydrolase, partial [Alphaproteobacteria bacterium]
MVGAVRGIDPETDQYFDDTKRYIDGSPNLSEADRNAIYMENTLNVFPRLRARLGK